MIFGFNTDVEVEGTVYHVQTEMRGQTALLESQIFVKGRCVGRRGSQPPAGIGDEGLHELARGQHRQVVEALRAGRLLGLVLPKDGTAGPKPVPQLAVEFLASQRLSAAELMLRFRVLRGESAAVGAKLSAIWKTVSPVAGDASTASAQDGDGATDVAGEGAAHAGADGIAELRVALGDSSAELEVNACLEGQETTRRFLIKSSKS